jgi:hypothetical protein
MRQRNGERRRRPKENDNVSIQHVWKENHISKHLQVKRIRPTLLGVTALDLLVQMKANTSPRQTISLHLQPNP